VLQGRTREVSEDELEADALENSTWFEVNFGERETGILPIRERYVRWLSSAAQRVVGWIRVDSLRDHGSPTIDVGW